VKILLINYEYPPIGAGAANAAYKIGKSMVHMGHDVYVLTSSFKHLKGRCIEEGIEIFRCKTIRKRLSQSNIFEMFVFVASAFFILPGLLKREKIDAMIVFFSFPCGPLGWWGKLVANVPYVISLRGGDVPGAEPYLDFIHRMLKPIRHNVFQKSLAIVANSEGLKMLSQKADNFPVKVISNGVDTDFFKPSNKKSKKTVFLFVGRFQNQKNLFFLLEQMDAAKCKVKEEFELHLVGDGPLSLVLKNHADKLKIKDRIFWHGWCSKEELRQHYKSADCVVNPSLYEGMPNVLLEAMASGLPVIASRVPGNETVIKHEETGFLFDLKQPDGFIKAVCRIIKDKDSAKSMGQRARKWIEKEFSWDRVAEGYIGLIKKN